MTDRDHTSYQIGATSWAPDGPRAPGLREPSGRLLRRAATRSSSYGRRPTRCRARSSRCGAAEPQDLAHGDRRARGARGGRRRRRARRGRRRRPGPVRPCASACGCPRPPCFVAAALALGLVAGFGVAQLGGGDGSRTVVATVDTARIPQGTGNLQLDEDGEDGAILRVNGMPDLQGRQVYQAWVQRGGMIIPQPTFEVGPNAARRRRRARGPERRAGRARDARAARRRPPRASSRS